METPVMYFYSPRDLDAHVKVAFPRGANHRMVSAADTRSFKRAGRWRAHRLERSERHRHVAASLTGAIEWPNIKLNRTPRPLCPIENCSQPLLRGPRNRQRSDYGRRSA